MGLDRTIDITAEQRKIVLALIERHLPNTTAWVYGSRAKWTARPQSDLDLVVFATPEQNGQVGELREAFEESNLPFRVDLFVWDTVPEQFRKHIKRDHVVVCWGEGKKHGMEDEWADRTPLRDLCESVVDCHHSTPVWTDTGVIVLRNQNIRNGRLDLSEPSYTDERHYAERTRRTAPRSGDLVITREAPMGEVCMVPAGLRCCLGQRMVLLRPDSAKTVPRYLLYALQSKTVRHEIGVSEGTGSTVSNLRIPLLEALPIPSRPLSEQRAIAHILGTLDDKIELNRRMNETLEAMARALFKSWFVDFDPVRAKMAGCNTGLPQEIAGLFPNRLVESELGLIPEGWKVESLEVIAQLEKATVKPEDHATEEFEHFSLPAYDSGQIPALDLGSTIKSNKTFVPPQAVLLSKLNPEIQRVWLPTSASSCRQISSTEFLVFTAKPPIGRVGLYSLFNTQSFRDLLKGMVTGTSKSHQRVAPKSLATQAMIVPADRAANKFEALAWPVLERTLRNKSENHTLAALRDTLLPKLISGKMRVDTERIVEIA